MNNFIISGVYKKMRLLFSLVILFICNYTYSQTVNLTDPTGGFEIDGDLISNSPTNGVGDWVLGNPGAGGFVLDNLGNPITVGTTELVRDLYNVNNENVFTAGSKANDDPSTWTWALSSATGKGDINNVMYHIARDVNNDDHVVESWTYKKSNRKYVFIDKEGTGIFTFSNGQ